MKILLAISHRVPAPLYGGTERVVVSLAVALADMGHRVVVVAAEGSTTFDQRVELIVNAQGKSWAETINSIPGIDVVHLNMRLTEPLDRPYIVTEHGNSSQGEALDRNSVFVSANHASRYGSDSFVHNGLDWREYGVPELGNSRKYFHFLGKAAWRVKNVRGAIDVARQSGERLVVAGGTRLNVKMGFRFTPYPSIRFRGMVGGPAKNAILQGSKGLLFPVRWNEPFGLAVTESLYFGCPVFGTPYGSLPELVGSEFGVLSDRADVLVESLHDLSRFDRRVLHSYALEKFDATTMARAYLQKYDRVISGEFLNPSAPELAVWEPKFLPFH